MRFDSATADELPALCAELAACLSERLRGRAFHEPVYSLVAELKLVGHELWSQDEDDAFQVWGPNYEAPRPGGGLVITFSAPDEVTVEPVVGTAFDAGMLADASRVRLRTERCTGA